MGDLAEALVFDDDPLMGRLTADILTGMGYSCRHFFDAYSAAERIRQAQPRLIVLDIMMPGTDGLTLCRQIRAHPAFQKIKIVIVSAKSSPDEKERALKAGADAFFSKPYDVAELKKFAAELLGAPQTRPGDKNGAASLRLQVWGCRGYCEKPPALSDYGTRTSCLSLQSASGETFIFDAGSGIADCSKELFAHGLPKELTLLLTHYHEDHVSGLKELGWAEQEGLVLKICGPQDQDAPLKKLVAQYLCQGKPAKSKIVCAHLSEGPYQLSPTVKLQAMYAQHPTTTLAFAFEISGKKIVYCPVGALPEEEDVAAGDYEEKLARLARGADILIHNAHLSPEDCAAGKEYGHSSWRGAVRLAASASVRQLLLFHHNPAYSDDFLKTLEIAARQGAREQAPAMKCAMAKDAMTLEL